MGKNALPLLQLLRRKKPECRKEELYAKIVAGTYSVNGETVRDPRKTVAVDAEITENIKRYVSRGGNKLEYALSRLGVDVSGKVFVDAGASTGGFSDCLLKAGARLVHAVDVGYNQLDYSLRTDGRVLVYERTNIMDVEGLDPPPHAAVADLSFRSITGAASHILGLTREKWAIVLVKPQFEYGIGDDDFNGIVRSADVLRKILIRVAGDLERKSVRVLNIIESPLLGRKGNAEFFFYLSRKGDVHGRGESEAQLESLAEQAVERALSPRVGAGRLSSGPIID